MPSEGPGGTISTSGAQDNIPFDILAFRVAQGLNEQVYERYGATTLRAEAITLDPDYLDKAIDLASCTGTLHAGTCWKEVQRLAA